MDFQRDFCILFVELRVAVRFDQSLAVVRRIRQIEVRAEEDDVEVVRFDPMLLVQDQVDVRPRTYFYLSPSIHFNHDAFDLARLSIIESPFKHDIDVRVDLRNGDQVQRPSVDHEVSGELDLFDRSDQVFYFVVNDVSFPRGRHVIGDVSD